MRLASFVCLLLLRSPAAQALYFEAGTGLGALRSGSAAFGVPTADTSNFSAGFGVYAPVTPPSAWGSISLGLHARATAGAATSGTSLAFGSANLAMRLELWRFFAGLGYSPITYRSRSGNGFLGLKGNREACSYFVETGAIWRVIPELQIIAAVSLETGLTGPNRSPVITEYGLRFRFPLHPREQAAPRGGSFDGYRYPFGIMK